MIKTELYLVRHGQSKAQTGEDNGCDPELSEKGLLQAKCLGKRLKSIKFDRIISSSMTRAFQTAAGVAEYQGGNIPIEVFPELCECGIDQYWQPDENRQKSFYNNIIYHSRSLNTVYENDKQRATDALNKAVYPFAYADFDECRECNEGIYKNNSKKILIAAHGMFNAYLIGLLVNFPFDENTVIEQRNTCINKFVLYTMNDVKRVRFCSFNDTSHLKSEIDTWKSVSNPEP